MDARFAYLYQAFIYDILSVAESRVESLGWCTCRVGKRATIWLQDMVMDLEALEVQMDKILPRGVKGTTGTQAR